MKVRDGPQRDSGLPSGSGAGTVVSAGDYVGTLAGVEVLRTSDEWNKSHEHSVSQHLCLESSS